MNIYRLHGDESGETRLTQIDLSENLKTLQWVTPRSKACSGYLRRLWPSRRSSSAKRMRAFTLRLGANFWLCCKANTKSSPRRVTVASSSAATCSSLTMLARRATTAGTAAKNTWSW